MNMQYLTLDGHKWKPAYVTDIPQRAIFFSQAKGIADFADECAEIALSQTNLASWNKPQVEVWLTKLRLEAADVWHDYQTNGPKCGAPFYHAFERAESASPAISDQKLQEWVERIKSCNDPYAKRILRNQESRKWMRDLYNRAYGT